MFLFFIEIGYFEYQIFQHLISFFSLFLRVGVSKDDILLFIKLWFGTLQQI